MKKLIINKATAELEHKKTELVYKRCRLEILGIIKKAPQEWKEGYIKAFENNPLTESELNFIKTNA